MPRHDLKFFPSVATPTIDIEPIFFDPVAQEGAISSFFTCILKDLFPEMQGDIVYVVYERSLQNIDLEAFKIGGTYRAECDTIEPYRIEKGGGSAYGGRLTI